MGIFAVRIYCLTFSGRALSAAGSVPFEWHFLDKLRVISGFRFLNFRVWGLGFDLNLSGVRLEV